MQPLALHSFIHLVEVLDALKPVLFVRALIDQILVGLAESGQVKSSHLVAGVCGQLSV